MNEEFFNSGIKKVRITINGIPHQLFAAGIQARVIYPEVTKYFLQGKI